MMQNSHILSRHPMLAMQQAVHSGLVEANVTAAVEGGRMFIQRMNADRSHSAHSAEVMSLSGHRSYVNWCAWSPDDSTIASVAEDGTVRLWSALSGQQLAQLCDCGVRLDCVTFSPDGRWLVAGGRESKLHVFECNSRKELASVPTSGNVARCEFSHNGKTLVTISPENNRLESWRVAVAATGSLQLTLDRSTVIKGLLAPFRFAPHEEHIIAIAVGRAVMLWNLKSNQEERTIGSMPKEVRIARKRTALPSLCFISPRL
jgi:WD40 repeat protein